MNSKKQTYHLQIIYLTLAAFFGMFSYPFTRTSATPFFNAAYGPEYLSWAMIAAAVLAIIVVSIYNQLAKRFALIPLCMASMAFIIVITIIFGFTMGHHPRWMALLFYAWSDVYVLILVAQFWGIANTLFDKTTAKKYYGIFLTSGSASSLAGNAVVTKLVEPLGAGNMIFFCAFSLIIFMWFIILLNNTIVKNKELHKKFNIEPDLAMSSTFGGASLVFKSRYLTLIMLLIVAVQFYINGTYFIYNNYVSGITNIVDKQSTLYAQIYLIIEIVTISLSFIATPLSLKYLGTSTTHLSIVGISIAVFAATLVMPQLAVVAILFIVSKSFDYSIFRAAREVLFIPLHTAEKFQAKSFTDVFIYRFSKAIAALGIILICQILNLSAFFLVGLGIIAWLILIILILRMYRTMQTSRT